MEDYEKLEELCSLQSQVNEIRLQDKLGNQIFIYDTKNDMNHLLTRLKIPLETFKKTNRNFY